MADYVEGARPYVVTSDDRRGVVALFTTLLLIWTLLSYMIRIYLRLSPRLPLGWDDAALTVATASKAAFAGIQSAVVFVQISNGYGKSLRLLSPDSVHKIEKADVASTIFFLLTLALTKVSVALLLARMTRDKSHLRACKAVAAASVVWLVLSVLVIFPGCGSHPWRHTDSRCSTQRPRWLFVSITNVMTNFALLALPIYIVWNLQTTFRRKAVVVIAFAFEIPVIVLALLRLHYLLRTIQSQDPTLNAAVSSLYTQFEMNIGLMAATIPCAKPFIQAFYTGYLTHQVPSPVLRDSNFPSYQLSDLSSSGKSLGKEPYPSISGACERAIVSPRPVYETDVLGGLDDAVDEGVLPTSEPRDLAIRQTTAWSVRSQPTSNPTAE